MNLATVWFILIAILWTSYPVLEGFDFGVGILLRNRLSRPGSGPADAIPTAAPPARFAAGQP
jgi:hypothetical protein